MELTAFPGTGISVQAVPRHVPDLRPAADAAASTQDAKPPAAMAIAAVPPPSPAQAAAVSRSLIGGTRGLEAGPDAAVPPVEEVERVLKPYGLMMLPYDRPGTDQADAKSDAVSDARSAGTPPADTPPADTARTDTRRREDANPVSRADAAPVAASSAARVQAEGAAPRAIAERLPETGPGAEPTLGEPQPPASDDVARNAEAAA